MSTVDDTVTEQVAQGYRVCARITREHGTTYYWGTILLPPERRRHVYAVYALCRLADDIVDAPGRDRPGPGGRDDRAPARASPSTSVRWRRAHRPRTP